MGIGENAHIAFNDPPVADFDDPCLIKTVKLDRECREQQVHDGCFPRLAEVPTHALTLTVPALVNAAHVFCMVPGAAKKNAISNILSGDIRNGTPVPFCAGAPTRCCMWTGKAGRKFRYWLTPFGIAVYE
jgi:glucosamine-6-phosphate deaminase